jgi:NADPH:quinone reductase-like Zn-dependent oxidoreductase
MQALQIDHHGPVSALTVSDVPGPTFSPHEVLIEIEAAAINPSDVASAEGRFDQALLPRILGHDFAGRVCDGPADLIGEDVWGSGGNLGIWRNGTHAEYIAIPRDGVALRPRALSVEEAAAVGVPFLTAWAALIDRGGLQEGEWVIISGAAGAVGSAAVQIAAARHAKVIALVRNASDDARVDAQKVAAIAHSESHDVAEVVREATGGKGANLAMNAIGGILFQPLLDVLAAEGRRWAGAKSRWTWWHSTAKTSRCMVSTPLLVTWCAARRCSISLRLCSHQGPSHRRASRNGIRCHRRLRRTSASPVARSC